MSSDTVSPLAWLEEHLDAAIASCCTNPERRIGHGNLRHEVSQWRRGAEGPTNIAVVYETPGGSTTQLNVSWDPETQTFSYLSHDLEGKIECTDPREVLHMIQQHVQTIPEKRQRQLQQQIDLWVDQGMSRSELFMQLNRLLQAEFLGGRITNGELHLGIQYAIRRYSEGRPTSP